MFTRVKRFKNKDGSFRDYLFIVENQWVKGKVKQRTVANLGRLEKVLATDTIDSLVESIAKYTKKQQIVNLCKDIHARSTKDYGEVLIFKKLWKELGFESLLRRYFGQTEKEVELVGAIFAMVCNRLIAPSSKRETNEWKDEVYEPEWEKYELHHFYRALDFLEEQKGAMEKDLFDQVRDLFNSKVNIMMFDTTTVSYWGEGKGNDLLRHGHAKNKRFDLKQLVVGIIMGQDGVPLGHEVWPGNMSDKPAFKEVIDKIKERYEIGKVILVCDRGMISEANLAYLEAHHYEYIIGVKMRQLSGIRRRLLLNDEGFRPITNHLVGKEMTEEELFKKEHIERQEIRKANGKASAIDDELLKAFKDSPKARRRWAVCCNELEARHDRIKREYFQQILQRKVEFSTAKEWIIKNGYKPYVIIKGMEITLNHKRLEEDEIYDGKWVLISNTDLPLVSLILAYKDLAQIEMHFRDLKSKLEIAPVYHYTERRIRAHVFVCFLALQIKVALTKKLKSIADDVSYSEVMRDVSRIRAVTFEVNNKRVILRTQLESRAHLAFKAVGCAIPSEMLRVDEITPVSQPPPTPPPLSTKQDKNLVPTSA